MTDISLDIHLNTNVTYSDRVQGVVNELINVGRRHYVLTHSLLRLNWALVSSNK